MKTVVGSRRPGGRESVVLVEEVPDTVGRQEKGTETNVVDGGVTTLPYTSDTSLNSGRLHV